MQKWCLPLLSRCSWWKFSYELRLISSISMAQCNDFKIAPCKFTCFSLLLGLILDALWWELTSLCCGVHTVQTHRESNNAIPMWIVVNRVIENDRVWFNANVPLLQYSMCDTEKIMPLDPSLSLCYNVKAIRWKLVSIELIRREYYTYTYMGESCNVCFHELTLQ